MAEYGWVPAITPSLFNCTQRNWDPQTFYELVDVSFGDVSTSTPRIYKQFTYDGCTGTLISAQTWPILTAIITLEKGVPQYIAWDDGCFFCAANDPTVCQYYAFDTGTWLPAQTSDYMSCLTPMSTCYTSTPAPTVSPYTTFSPTATPSVSATPNITATLSPAPTPSPANTTGNFTLPQSECDLKLFIVWSGSDANNQYFTSANKRFSRFRQFGTATAFQSAINIGLQGLTIAQETLGLVDGVPGRLLPGSQVRRRMRRLHGSSAANYGEHQAVEGRQTIDEMEEGSSDLLQQVSAQVQAATEIRVPLGNNAAAPAVAQPSLHPWLERSKHKSNEIDARLAEHHAAARARMQEEAEERRKKQEEELQKKLREREQAEAAAAADKAD